MDDSIAYTVGELYELRDHIYTGDIVSADIAHILLGGLCIE